MGAKELRYFYVGFATPRNFGCVVACYEGDFDFADAQETLEKKRGRDSVILSVYEISRVQFDRINEAKRKEPKRLKVVSPPGSPPGARH